MIELFTPSKLRANLYRILDQVLATGRPVEIKRKGRRLRIASAGERDVALLKRHPEYLRTPKESIVHIDWSHEWRP